MENTSQQKGIIHSLLTEDRFWTFWSLDWKKKVYVQWNGKTKFKKIIRAMQKRIGSNEIGYKRQVQVKQPEVIFE